MGAEWVCRAVEAEGQWLVQGTLHRPTWRFQAGSRRWEGLGVTSERAWTSAVENSWLWGPNCVL